MRYLLFIAAAALAWCEMPDCGIAAGWQQSGPRRSYVGENLYDYMNGNSEGYLIYGFRKMTGVTCKSDQSTILIDVSDMGDPEDAFAIFSANRDVKSPVETIGMGAQILPRKAIVAKGPYYIEIAAEAEGDHRDMLRQMATALARQVEGRSTPPDALQWFPCDRMHPGYPRLIPQSVLGIRVLKRGYVAQYEDGSKAFVVADSSPKAAAATLDKLKERLADPADVKVGDSAFIGTDKYLRKMMIFRKGRYVAGYATVPDDADAAGLATSLAERIP